MLDDNNPLVESFRIAQDRFSSDPIPEFQIQIINARATDSRINNTPTASEVAGIIIGNLSSINCERDIIVHH